VTADDRPFRPAGRFRSKLYGLLWRASDGLHRAGRACECLAAGVLRRSDLQAVLERQFRGFGASADDIDEGLSPFETRVYGQWLPRSGRILLVGCGAGRDLVALARQGHDVTGVEPSADLVEATRVHLSQRGVAGAVTHGSIESVPLNASYDAVIFAPFCYSNVQSTAARVAVLSRVRRHLSPGGRVFVSYLTAPSRSNAATALMRAGAGLSSADWWPEPGDTFARHREFRGVLYFHHAFGEGEVVKECSAAGLRALGEYSSSRSTCIVLEAEQAIHYDGLA